jgi:UDP-N-acetylglucosamine 1-carboxyvinyltransferase
MAQKFLVKGGNPLKGQVQISGYKNSAGAILAAALLSEKPSIISNLPQVSDVLNQIEIMSQIGGEIEWIDDHTVKVNAKNLDPQKIPANIFQKMRVSVLLIGPLLARFRSFRVPHPGGDKIGLRPISTHLDAFEQFGIKIWRENGFYCFEAPKDLKPAHIILKEFSVTATENAMMLAAGIEGKSVIEIAAAEPQVQDLIMMLENMGAKIVWTHPHTLEIQGTKNLSGANHEICPDPLETGTFMIALAITGGQGKITHTNPRHLTFFLEKMKEIGVNFNLGENSITVNPSADFKAARVQVMLYPGFPTDLQPQISVLLTQAAGKTLIHEPLYENRLRHFEELRKMGADIEITDPHRALIFGKTELLGTTVDASDIRSGTTLTLAALIAQGQTIVENISNIERGSEKFDEKLRSLGADIEKIGE